MLLFIPLYIGLSRCPKGTIFILLLVFHRRSTVLSAAASSASNRRSELQTDSSAPSFPQGSKTQLPKAAS
ncbi:hypothetical protein COP2_039476 [Malus domestica]